MLLKIKFLCFILFKKIFLAALGLHCCSGFSLVAASRGYALLLRSGCSWRWLLSSQGTGSWRVSFSSFSLRALGHGLRHCGSRSSLLRIMGVFPDQGPNPCPLHGQAILNPLCHQGSPVVCFYFSFFWGLFLMVTIFSFLNVRTDHVIKQGLHI